MNNRVEQRQNYRSSESSGGKECQAMFALLL